MKLKWRDPEYRKMISDAIRGFKHTTESRLKMSIQRTGHVTTEEQKIKLRYAMNKYYKQHNTKRHIICKLCGKGVLVRRSSKRLFCDKHCYSVWQRLSPPELNNAYIDGRSFEPYPIQWKKIRRLVRIRDRHICQECGASQIECIQALCVHHIDHNKNNTQFTNLISLCHSCHSKRHQKERAGVRR